MRLSPSIGDTEQALAADGAIACFSSNLFPFSLNADRAAQLKAGVIWLKGANGMAFSDIELKRIEKLVHGLCERRSPAYLKDTVRLGYTVKNHEILIYEARPRWDEPSEWLESSIAKLRYVRASKEWRLYWQRANLKWWLYEPHSSSKSLSSMLDEIDSDPHGCFFG